MWKRKPLDERLNPHQQEKRRTRMNTRGTWRQQMEREHAITRGGVNQSFTAIQTLAVRQRRIVYALSGAAIVQAGVIAGHLFGRW